MQELTLPRPVQIVFSSQWMPVCVRLVAPTAAGLAAVGVRRDEKGKNPLKGIVLLFMVLAQLRTEAVLQDLQLVLFGSASPCRASR